MASVSDSTHLEPLPNQATAPESPLTDWDLSSLSATSEADRPEIKPPPPPSLMRLAVFRLSRAWREARLTPGPDFVLSTAPWLSSLAIHLLLLIGLTLYAAANVRPAVVNSAPTFSFADDYSGQDLPIIYLEKADEVFEQQASEVVGEPGAETTLERLDEALADSQASAATMENSLAALSGPPAAGVATLQGAAPAALGTFGGVFGGTGRGGGSGLHSAGISAAGLTSFYGVKSAGNNFVFIVDASRSMQDGKFDAARKELEYTLRQLSPEQSFYIVFFNDDAYRMHFADELLPVDGLVPATSGNIDRAAKWMESFKVDRRTNPFDAVKFAVSLKPDAIYILSDGKFTDQGRTARFLRNYNVIKDEQLGYRARVVVNTIAFWRRDGEETMKAIAKANRGTYRFVPSVLEQN